MRRLVINPFHQIVIHWIFVNTCNSYLYFTNISMNVLYFPFTKAAAMQYSAMDETIEKHVILPLCLSVCLYCNVIRLCSCVGLSVSQLQRRECVPYVDLYRVHINHHVNYVQSKLSWEKQVMIAAQSHNVHRLLNWLIFWLDYIQTSDFRGSCSYYTVLTL